MSGNIEVNTTVNDSAFQRALLRFAAYKNKGIPGVVRAQARLMCVNLAHNTQPYGNDDAARFHGQNAVRRDLSKVFIGSERLVEIARAGLSTRNRASHMLLVAAETGNLEGMRTAWQILSQRPITAAKSPDESWHQSQRNGRGRVRGKGRLMIVASDSALRLYRLRKEKLVGFAKSGWATAARMIGGTRGIAGWVTRNKGPGDAEDLTNDSDNPRVILTSSVRYISMVLPDTEVQAALKIQREKMQRAIEIQMNQEAKAAGF